MNRKILGCRGVKVMHLTSIITWRELLPLGNQIFLDLDERVNLFIGPNASGKSTILRAIRDASSVSFTHADTEGDLGLGDIVVGLSDDWDEDWPRDSDGRLTDERTTIRDTVPLLYVPVTRFNLPVKNLFGPTIDDVDDWPLTPNKSLDDYEFVYYGVFYGNFVESTIDSLRQAKNINQRQRNQLRRAVEVGYSCAKKICPEVIRDDVPHTFVEVDEDHEISDTGRIVHYGMGIGTNDDVLGEPLYTGVLSSGTQGTLLWIWALALKIAHYHDWEEGWDKQPAILLIDEIENHLHPTWQRRVIPALLDHFPGLQIFATTHSPFVVAGLEAGQVHLLSRDKGGLVTATPNKQDVIGWTADEILRTMMGVDEPTDQLTVDRARRMRQLREKETLTPKEESELDRLRREVNEHFLAKAGPLEAQRERYADLMQRFLLSRGSDFTQDGD